MSNPTLGWIGAMLRHDADLNANDEAPTGEDYNNIFPTTLGFIWHTCDDIGEFYTHAINITQHQGLIQSVTERDDGLIDVVFAITAQNYEAMIGRQPDGEEWLNFED